MNKLDRLRIKQRAAELKQEAAESLHTNYVETGEDAPNRLANAAGALAKEAIRKKPKPAVAPPAEAPTPKRIQPSTLMLAHACGHRRPMADYTSIDCPACRNVARQERNRLRQERRAKVVDPQQHGRLPHGSRFTKWYDAPTQTWNGMLFVPVKTTDGGMDFQVFEGSAPAERKLEWQLDAAYRKWLAEQTGEGATP